MPTIFNEDFDDEVNPLLEGVRMNPDYFSVYKMKPLGFNPEKPLSEFHTGTPRFKSAEELEGRLKDYLVVALQNGQPLTVSGMANSIGVSRKQFLDFRDWYKNAKTEEDLMIGVKVNRIISSALAIAEQYSEEKLFDGHMKPQGIIFHMVNNFGWRNKIDVEANDHSEELSEIREAYRKLTEKQKELPARGESQADKG